MEFSQVIVTLVVALIGATPATIAVLYNIRATNRSVQKSEANAASLVVVNKIATEARDSAQENASLTKQLEINTNSIKDALVAAEKGKSKLEGRDEARVEGEDRATALREADARVETARTTANPAVAGPKPQG